jgi:hypothetical protein
MMAPPMIKRIVVSLCLALLAAAIPEVRAAILDRIGATEFAQHDAAAGGLNKAVSAVR